MMARESYIDIPGGRIFALEWGEGPLMVFTHATGMCARVYSELLEPLAGRFRVVAYDARGHGRTELAAVPGDIPADWMLYRQDLAHLVTALGGGPVRLAGHSFGATTSLEAAAIYPGLASSVCLIDPPFIPFEAAAAYRAARAAGRFPNDHMAAQAERRRAHFASRAAVRAGYHGRGVFAGWSDRALDDYLDGGLLPDEEGEGVRLACTPAWEATSFRGISTTFEDSLARADIPIVLLVAGDDSALPGDSEQLVRSRKPDAVTRRFPGTGHFLPVTHPDLVRPYLAALT